MNADVLDALPRADRDPTAPIADALVVTLCASVGLDTWASCGILHREWALYHRLSTRYRQILLVTEGGPADHDIAKALPAACPVAVIANDNKLDRPAFAATVPQRVRELLLSPPGRGTVGPLHPANARAPTTPSPTSIVIKTDQMWGGDLAISIAANLRDAGLRVGLIARGGYPWSRFVAWEQGPSSPFAAEAAAAEAELCRAADVVVGSTERLLDDLRWRYSLDNDRTLCVPNFLPDDARPDESITRQPNTILYAGRLAPQKRIDLLIDAVALLSSASLSSNLRGGALWAPSSSPSLAPPQAPNTPRLVLIGEGPLEATLRAQAADRAIQATFLPRLPQPELLAHMRRCAVYAQASAYEGHPKTVLEALACAAPTVVADAWGLSDAVAAGITGLIARPDPESLARAIARLLTDRDLAASLGREAARDAERLRLDNILPLEARAHELAIARAGERTSPPPGAVRWGAELLAADADTAAQAWARSLHGYSRRLAPDKRALFCATVETPIYHVIDQAALDSGRGVHPKHHLMRYHDFFVERIGEGETVLDLGCGYAEVARSIATGARALVTGMDFSPANLAQAQKMIDREGLAARLRVVEGDITRDRAARADGDHHFDVVVLSNVLEHLQDRATLLRRYARWYTPRTILIRVPAFDRNWQTAWKAKLGVDPRCDDTHETEYTESSLRAELAAAGLTIEELIVRWGEYWVKAGVAA
ncbi:MAG: glycosyltransferase [Phycisphaerales bacterium]|nr:glycosyltransferase [Phycisphaerales bacterium]